MSLCIRNDILNKGWKSWMIMHRDRRVATVREDGSCTVYYPSFLPYNLYLEETDSDDLDTRLNNLANFYYWCASRVLTLDRKYAKEILNNIGAGQAVTDKERAAVAISYHGVSLTDVYWIRTGREKIRFEEISLYRHSLSNAFADVSLRGRHLTVENSELLSFKESAGDVATSGVAPKAWIRRSGEFWLLKNGDLRDVEAELLASRIADCFAVDHVAYNEGLFEGKKVTESRMITSEDRSIVSMEFVQVYCTNREQDVHEFVLKKDAYAFYMMNIIDYLVGNTDRHWGNWGFFVNNDTNTLERLYPLMDFNKSFRAYGSLEGAPCQTVGRRCSQKDAAIEAVRAIGLNQTADVKKEWFLSKTKAKMFFARLALLEKMSCTDSTAHSSTTE